MTLAKISLHGILELDSCLHITGLIDSFMFMLLTCYVVLGSTTFPNFVERNNFCFQLL